MEPETKNTYLNIRLTQDESKRFIEYANQIGVQRSQLLRKVIRELINRQPDLLTEEMKLFKDATRQVAAIGTNLNQLTRTLNSGHWPDMLNNEALNELRGYVKDVRTELNKVISATQTRWVKGADDD